MRWHLEHRVTALDSIDLTSSQKLDPRFYPAGHVVVFNRKLGPYAKGAQGRMIAANRAGIVVEAQGKVRLVKAKHADHLTVFTPHALAVSSQDRLQLKANAKALAGEALANGEVVTVKAVRASGEIELTDGRALPANYRQFVRGYAVTSYSSQGKTVDHVLLGDSAVRAATNAQQWYVSISRGRKSIRIFTPNKARLRVHIARRGDRPLAVDLESARRADRRGLLHGLRRGRSFAKAVCLSIARRFHPTQTNHESVTV